MVPFLARRCRSRLHSATVATITSRCSPIQLEAVLILEAVRPHSEEVSVDIDDDGTTSLARRSNSTQCTHMPPSTHGRANSRYL